MIDVWDWQEAVTGDRETRQRFSASQQIKDMIRVEAAYARALGQVGQVPSDIANAAATGIEAATIDPDLLVRDAAVDGMPVPSLSRQLRAQIDEALHPAVHTGLTSQDVMDTALVLALADTLGCFESRLTAFRDHLSQLKAEFGRLPLMGRTRMQAAWPIKVEDRLRIWAQPFSSHVKRLRELKENILILQLGGPVGTRESFGNHGGAIAAAMAQSLGIRAANQAWHTDRSGLADLASWLSAVSGGLGKIGHDIALMSQQGVDAAQLKVGGRSSAMAHKVNPVKAETLVALAKFNSVQLAGMHLALDHEQERSGASWTLEWLILPRMLEATGAALLRAQALLEDVGRLGERS